MIDLLKLQEQFQQYILTGHSDIPDGVLPTQTLTVDKRLAIYRNAYQLRLTEALATSFPALHQYLGVDAFQGLCRDYIDVHPSVFRSIRWYGNSLADYIKHRHHKDDVYLAELAEFEWKMTLAFDAADNEVLQIEDMASVPAELWAGLQFKPHASVQRLNHFWNAIPVWQALIHHQELPPWDNHSQMTPWILWRTPHQVIQYYRLIEEESWALDAMIQGLSFGELCAGLCQWVAVEEVSMKAASFLKNWIQQGIISKLLIGD